MSVRPETSPRLPSGLSPAEEARWWDEHRDYWDGPEGADERIDPAMARRTKPVNLRLPVNMIDQLKQEATRRALPYQTLIRMWLKERLDAEASQARQ
ncbi:MAG: CopG family antitoxin [Chloroflexota bacterium]